MEHNLFRYIWRHTRLQQLYILGVILLSFPFYYYALELPKAIVNGPIQGKGFATADATQRFFEIKLSLPAVIAAQPVPLFSGFQLERLPDLVGLSLLFLALVCINGLFKFYINTYKGRMGERMLRRLRYELVDRVLRFPVPLFKKIRAAEIATMVKDEVEPLGGFIGDAFVQPAFLSGQAATAMIFIILQNYLLGFIAAGIVLVQAFLIPRLRKRLLVLGRQQQLTARELAGRVGEIVDGIQEVRTNDASNLERADISSRLGRIFQIRYELFQRKFFVKFLNNFLAQLTPFFFYLIGGYFAIKGQLDIGQLVAVIAAYKDLPPPIKELIDWDQQRQDVQIKYNQVAEQFSPEAMLAAALQAPTPGQPPRLSGHLEIKGLGLQDETGAKLIEQADLIVRPGERVAAVGEVNSGAEAMSEALARLLPATSGRIRLGADPLEGLSEAITGRRVAYVGPDTYLRNTSLGDALVYGLMHHPRVEPPSLSSMSAALAASTANGAPQASRTFGRRARPKLSAADAKAAFSSAEAINSGNSLLDLEADWIDYEGAGVADRAGLMARLVQVLRDVELYDDVFELGLRTPLVMANDDVKARVLAARQAFQTRVSGSGMQRLVEVFDEGRYCTQASIARNLLFGASQSPSFSPANLPGNVYVRSVLAKSGLDVKLFEVGRRFAATLVELFADLKSDNPFSSQLSQLGIDDITVYEQALARVAERPFAEVAAKDKELFLTMSLNYNEPRQRLGLLDDALRAQILGTRQMLRKGMPRDMASQIAFYNAGEVNSASSLEDNILFGRVVYGIANGANLVREATRSVLHDMALDDLVVDAGLGFSVGAGGKRLTIQQRQKVGLARALLKRPELLIVNRGLNGLGAKSQRTIIDRVIKLDRIQGTKAQPMSVFWVLAMPDLVQGFDRVVSFRDGRLSEQPRLAERVGEPGLEPQSATLQSATPA